MSNIYGIMADIERIVGKDVSVKIGMAFGGTRINIPKIPRVGQDLTDLIGLDAVQKIASELGTGEIQIPMGAFRGWRYKKAQIAKMLDAGETLVSIARKMEVHVETVRKIKKKNYSNVLPLLELIEKKKEEKK